MWLSLIPQLHNPGDLSDLTMRHHHFNEEAAQYYDGMLSHRLNINTQLCVYRRSDKSADRQADMCDATHIFSHTCMQSRYFAHCKSRIAVVLFGVHIVLDNRPISR